MAFLNDFGFGGYGYDDSSYTPTRSRQQVVNKRARKTIRKAISYYKQLRKLEKGIEKMAGKAGLRRHSSGGYRPRRRYFRRR